MDAEAADNSRATINFMLSESNGKKEFKCLLCNSTCSTRKRILSHIASIHKDNHHLRGRKVDCYDTIPGENNQNRFKCKICLRVLSSKQRISHHLHRYHGKSPVSKMYKKYQTDPPLSVPERTLRIHRAGEKSNNSPSSPTCVHPDSSDSNCEHSDGNMSGISVLLSSSDEEAEYRSVNGNQVLNDSSTDQNISNSTDCDSNSRIQESYSDDSDVYWDSSDDSSLLISADCSNSEDNDLLNFSDTNEGFSVEKNQNDRFLNDDDAFSICYSAFVAKYNISGEAGKDLEKLIDLKSECNNTASRIRKVCEIPSLNHKYVHYCSVCSAIFENDEFVCNAQGCDNYRYKGGIMSQTSERRQPKTYFIIADIESQLRQILEKQDNWQDVQDTKKRVCLSDDKLSDITNGAYYCSQSLPGKFLAHSNNISAMFNTDGVPLYSSSHVKLWPIFLAINELPVKKRFSRENIILCGIWQGKDKPPFVQYMQTFGEEMVRLMDDGFFINVPGWGQICVKLQLLCGSVDLQAKAYILNMSMFNGAFGCSTCEEEGVVERQGKGHARSFPFREERDAPRLRSSDDIKCVKGPNATKKKKTE